MSRITRAWLAGALVVLAIGLAPAVTTTAQTLYGNLVGTVTDTSGAVLPGATVTARNAGTGLVQTTTTDEVGAFRLPNLLPGTYDVTISLQSFTDHQRTAVPVAAGAAVRVDAALTVGGLTEAVTVTSETTLLQTEKSDLSTQITSKEVTNLPLNAYRNYQSLMNLVPGATPVQFQNAEIDTPGRSLRTWVNGTQPNNNATRIDGAVSVNIWLPHHVGYISPAETIETVNVATNNFDADQGMASGAAVTVVTKSGTNELRGSGFWFLNRDEFNANTFQNNAANLPKPAIARDTVGGTLGGPIRQNAVFYFGSWERYQDRRGSQFTYGVPTAAMRNGDFREVAARYPAFGLYNPMTGGAEGTGREQFPSFQIPAGMISPIARAINNYYPLPNSDIDINGNGLVDDYTQAREVRHDRDSFDLKLTWQRTTAHQIWGKFSMLDAEVIDNFILGFDNGSIGDTRVYVPTFGHTWTLGPTMVLDSNFGMNRQDQTVTGPDYGQNIGLDLGIPGTNGPDIRQSGMPTFANGYMIGGTPSWMPLFRKEKSYTFSTAITKLAGRHQIRSGFDFVRHQLNHVQAEQGPYGVRGGFSFSGLVTATPGVLPLAWNQYAAFLLGQPNFFSKDVQTEEMIGRENQFGLYVRDRWEVRRNLTLNLGLRVEAYPLMNRDTRGLERLEYDTYTVLIGGFGGVPRDVGLNVQTFYLAPRLGVAWRVTEDSVVRAGYGRTFNALPWSRPLRGSFPQDIYFNRTADNYFWTTTLAEGIPPVPVPDISSGRVQLPRGVFMRSPNPNQLDRNGIDQINVAYERRLPGRISTEVAYVHTRTDGGYADLNLNYGEPGGGNASRKYFDVAGTTAITDWANRMKSRYHALQVAVNRPFQNGFLLKGAYTLSRARNMSSNDEDGWTSLNWNHPAMYDQNFALAGFDRTHIFQMGFVWELPFLRETQGVLGAVAGGWQVNGIFAAFSGTPYTIGGSNPELNCPGCGSVTINVSGDPTPIGKAGSSTEPYYDRSIFSQPTGATIAGFGNSGRNAFRRPAVWNLDFSAFKAFPIGRFRPELRVETLNILNHPNWGLPVTDIQNARFMTFLPSAVNNGTNTPGSRAVQIGLRFQF
jgi:hypothetical protein